MSRLKPTLDLRGQGHKNLTSRCFEAKAWPRGLHDGLLSIHWTAKFVDSVHTVDTLDQRYVLMPAAVFVDSAHTVDTLDQRYVLMLAAMFIDSVHMVDTLDQRHVLISAAVKDAYLVVCWQCPHGGHIRPTLCVDAGRHVYW